MNKKLWKILFAGAMTFCLAFGIAACGGGETPDDVQGGGEGQEELVPTEGLQFKLNDDKESFTVTGITTIDITELVIPAVYLDLPVTAIADDAFSSCIRLEKITIPDSVVAVGSDAFANTVYYETAKNWSGNVLYIGNYLIGAKEDYAGSFRVKPGTRVIAENVFWYNKTLTEVVIPDSVVTIGDGAFMGCTALTKVTVGAA